MPKKKDPTRFITIEVVHDPVRAEVIRDVLAQEGVESIVPAASGGGVLVGVAAGALDIPIQVRAIDADAAREIIDAMQDFDAVLPDGEDGAVVPAEEMQRRLERLDAEEEGEGPYREAPVHSPKRSDSPRLLRIALPAAMIIPFGGAHLYAREYRAGAVLALAQVLMCALVMSGDVRAIWGFLGVIAADMFGAAAAVKRFNENRPPTSLKDHASPIAAVILAALFATPWVLRSAYPVSYLDSEIETVCRAFESAPTPRRECRRELEDALATGRIAPGRVDDCASCIERTREEREGDRFDCALECGATLPR